MTTRTLLSVVALSILLVTPLASYADSHSRQLDASAAPLSPEETKPLGIGNMVPSVSLQNAAGASLELAALIAARPTVLIFYRGGWCPYCNLHLGELSKLEPELAKLGYQLLAISPDKPEKLTQAQNKHKFSYTLLSDSKMTAATAFGIAFKVDDETVTLYKEKYNIDLEADSGETHHLLPVPAAYVVSKNGEIRFAYTNPDYKVRVSPDDLLAAARAELGLHGSAPLSEDQ